MVLLSTHNIHVCLVENKKIEPVHEILVLSHTYVSSESSDKPVKTCAVLP